MAESSAVVNQIRTVGPKSTPVAPFTGSDFLTKPLLALGPVQVTDEIVGDALGALVGLGTFVAFPPPFPFGALVGVGVLVEIGPIGVFKDVGVAVAVFLVCPLGIFDVAVGV